MKSVFISMICLFMAFTSANAQLRIVDAQDKLPVVAASVFDASGNMVGYTTTDGVVSDISASAYPITLRCMGYEQLVIDKEENKTWEMTPAMYQLQELVVGLEKRNIMKQTFYAREYFSITSSKDTVNYFIEHMTERFVPVAKDAKAVGNSSLRITGSRIYAKYKIGDEDSTVVETESKFPTMMAFLMLKDEEIAAPESFKTDDNQVKIHEKEGKSGVSIIYKQNAHSFTTVEDKLAKEEEHSSSPWALKLLGLSMDIKQLYVTHAYILNEEGVYLPGDLKEASFVFEADGKGKLFRKIFRSDEVVLLRSMVEIYLVDMDYLTREEAKEEYDNKKKGANFTIPASVPPLNDATRRLVEEAKAGAKL